MTNTGNTPADSAGEGGELKTASIFLTVADHDANGFVHLGQWAGFTETEARTVLANIDAMIDDDAQPDEHDAPYWFIADLRLGDDLVDNNKKRMPTQTAMSLAPDRVSDWLATRPDPDTLCMTDSYENPPALDRAHLPQGAAS